jgi:hypothetical protein
MKKRASRTTGAQGADMSEANILPVDRCPPAPDADMKSRDTVPIQVSAGSSTIAGSTVAPDADTSGTNSCAVRGCDRKYFETGWVGGTKDVLLDLCLYHVRQMRALWIIPPKSYDWIWAMKEPGPLDKWVTP